MTEEQFEISKNLETRMETFDKNCLSQLAARNDLETYVLNAQTSFADGGIYYDYMLNNEKEEFMTQIFNVDEWLSEDVDMDKSTVEYVNKLTKIKEIGDIYKSRYDEWEKYPIMLDTFNKEFEIIQNWILVERKNLDYKHITDKQIEELKMKTLELEELFKNMKIQHDNLKKTQNPLYKKINILDKLDKLKSIYTKVKNIPKLEVKKDEEDLKKNKTKEINTEKDIEMKDKKTTE
jgi:hypothetical protein